MLKIRLDKFVWCVRLCKTRSQGTELISKGQIKLNSLTTKPSKEVKLKDIISVHKNSAVFSFNVIELLDKRVGAALIENFIIDITPIEEKEKICAVRQHVENVANQHGAAVETMLRKLFTGFQRTNVARDMPMILLNLHNQVCFQSFSVRSR